MTNWELFGMMIKLEGVKVKLMYVRLRMILLRWWLAVNGYDVEKLVN